MSLYIVNAASHAAADTELLLMLMTAMKIVHRLVLSFIFYTLLFSPFTSNKHLSYLRNELDPYVLYVHMVRYALVMHLSISNLNELERSRLCGLCVCYIYFSFHLCTCNQNACHACGSGVQIAPDGSVPCSLREQSSAQVSEFKRPAHQ